jgi:Undecaprenyl pyrophosphate synthetase (EC 2.5.1.31)
MTGHEKAEPLSLEKLPYHVAIIMDGNGRWAKARGLPRVYGHKKGVETARKIVLKSQEIGIKYLSLFTFSKENWQRPEAEIQALFQLLEEYLLKELPTMKEKGVRLGYRARIRNHGHSCFLCEIVIRSQFHTTYEPEA